MPNRETSLSRDNDSRPAVKRQREDDDKTPDTTTRPRAPSSRSRTQNSGSKAAPVKSIRGFPATESGGGCWMEHRDAVSTKIGGLRTNIAGHLSRLEPKG